MEIFLQIYNTGVGLFLEVLPFGIFFFLIEQMNKAEKNSNFFRKDTLINFSLYFINTLLDALILTLIIGYYLYTLTQYVNFQIFHSLNTWPFILQVLISLMIFDFFTYWEHRIAHKFFWPFHAVHHSETKISWITGLRLHPVEHLIQYFFLATALFVIGLPDNAISVTMFIVICYNYMNHANLKLKYISPIRFIFVSPHYHRWHHANKVEAYDKNFAGIFPFWDKLFGTYYHPEDLPKEYGLNKKDSEIYNDSYIGNLYYPFKYYIRKYRENKKK